MKKLINIDTISSVRLYPENESHYVEWCNEIKIGSWLIRKGGFRYKFVNWGDYLTGKELINYRIDGKELYDLPYIKVITPNEDHILRLTDAINLNFDNIDDLFLYLQHQIDKKIIV
jgi:hypothetical protein